MNASMPHLLRAGSSGPPAVSGGYAGSPYAGSPLAARLGAGNASARAVTAAPASRPAASTPSAQPRSLYSAPSSDLHRASSDDTGGGNRGAGDVALQVPSILRTAGVTRRLQGSVSTPVLPRVHATRPQTVPAPVTSLSPLPPQRAQTSSRSGGAVQFTSPTRRFAYSKAAGLDMRSMHGHNGLFVVPTLITRAVSQMGENERATDQLERLLRARSQAPKGGLS